MSRRRNVKPRFWLLMMTVVLVVFSFIYAAQADALRGRATLIAQLEAERAQWIKASAEIERKIAFAKTDEYIERVAHDELGLVKEGEIRFVTNGQ